MPCVPRHSGLQQTCARRRSCAFIAAHACNSLALVVALACNSPVHSSSLIIGQFASVLPSSTLKLGWRTSFAFIAAHRCSCQRMPCVVAFIAAHACNSLALSSTLKLENVLRSSSLVLALALRSPIVCLSILNIHPHVRDMPCVHHHRTCLQEPNTHRSSSLLTLAIILRSSTLKLRTILRSTTLIASLSQSTYPHIYACSSGRRKRPHRCAFALCSV